VKIADLDQSTRGLIFAAECMAKWPSNKRLRMLKRAVRNFDEAHSEERTRNLIAAIFCDWQDKEGIKGDAQ